MIYFLNLGSCEDFYQSDLVSTAQGNHRREKQKQNIANKERQ